MKTTLFHRFSRAGGRRIAVAALGACSVAMLSGCVAVPGGGYSDPYYYGSPAPVVAPSVYYQESYYGGGGYYGGRPYYGGPAYIAGYTPTGENSMYAYLVFDAEDHFRMSPEEGARIMIEGSRAYGGPWESIRADLAAGGAEVNYTWFTRHIVDAPWNRGRVVLIGDAAHSCPPTIAQGAAQALEDALVLADVVTRREVIDQDLWDEFHRRRVERATAVVDASVQLAEWQRDGQDHSHEMPQLIGELQRRIESAA